MSTPQTPDTIMAIWQEVSAGLSVPCDVVQPWAEARMRLDSLTVELDLSPHASERFIREMLTTVCRSFEKSPAVLREDTGLPIIIGSAEVKAYCWVPDERLHSRVQDAIQFRFDNDCLTFRAQAYLKGVEETP